ncbi:MAG: hypothetical protein G8345_05690 [Magnetococcales bacterium]|nr:hypothetical protein [Magnetococcales bacterium]NGZ26361.1 hypothetical protein [Magnetococcales bacterium]
MPYITSVERIGMEKGMQIGKQRGELKGMAAMLLEQLHERFGSVPDWCRSKLAEADLETLKKWGRKIFGAEKSNKSFYELAVR